MTDHKTTSKRPLLIAGFALALCLAAAGASAWTSPAGPRQDAPPRAENRTNNLRLVSAEPEGRGVRLVLQNDGGKKIVAYSVAVGNFQVEEDFVYSGRGIAPGATATVDFATARPGSVVQVLAAVFDDGTSEGDEGKVAAIKGRRLGDKRQLQRVVQLIQATLKAPAGVTPEEIDKLKSKVRALPESDSDDDSEAVRGSLRTKKASVIQDLDAALNAGRDPEALADRLEWLKSHYQQLISKM